MSHRVTELHNIMPIANIPSVLKHGILSHERCAKLPHSDVSMADVQDRRDKVRVPGGLRLHQYANLYFHARNPMMSARNHQATHLSILRVSTEVLGLQGVVISDQNAASKYVRFRAPDGLDELNFDKIYAEDWRHPDDKVAYWRHKSMKCAEVLVPDFIDAKYIQGAYVVSQEVKRQLQQFGFPGSIEVNRHIFLL